MVYGGAGHRHLPGVLLQKGGDEGAQCCQRQDNEGVAKLSRRRQEQQALTQRHSAISEYLQAKTRYLIATGRSTY